MTESDQDHVCPPVGVRCRRSVWVVTLDGALRFSTSKAKLLLAVHEEDGAVFDLLGQTPFGSDLHLGGDSDTMQVIGSASLVYPEDDYEIYERCLYVIPATATKSVMG